MIKQCIIFVVFNDYKQKVGGLQKPSNKLKIKLLT